MSNTYNLYEVKVLQTKKKLTQNTYTKKIKYLYEEIIFLKKN